MVKLASRGGRSRTSSRTKTGRCDETSRDAVEEWEGEKTSRMERLCVFSQTRGMKMVEETGSNRASGPYLRVSGQHMPIGCRTSGTHDSRTAGSSLPTNSRRLLINRLASRSVASGSSSKAVTRSPAPLLTSPAMAIVRGESEELDKANEARDSSSGREGSTGNGAAKRDASMSAMICRKSEAGSLDVADAEVDASEAYCRTDDDGPGVGLLHVVDDARVPLLRVESVRKWSERGECRAPDAATVLAAPAAVLDALTVAIAMLQVLSSVVGRRTGLASHS